MKKDQTAFRKIRKGMVHLLLFVLVALTMGEVYKITAYNTAYNEAKTFTETPAFEERFCKYIERLAAYVSYRRQGYVKQNALEIPSEIPFQGDTKYLHENQNQSLFDFYNKKLNQQATNFLYYAEDITTGEVYFSPLLTVRMNQDPEAKGLGEKSYLLHLISKNSNYFILNASEEKYSTSLSDYEYMNQETLQWIIDSVSQSVPTGIIQDLNQESSAEISIIDKAKDSQETSWILSTQGAEPTGDPVLTGQHSYLLYATVLEDFPYSEDDFSPLYQQWESRKNAATRARTYAMVYAGLFLLLFFYAIALAGHPAKASKEDKTIALSPSDHLFTEFGVLFYGAVIFLGFYLSNRCYYTLRDIVWGNEIPDPYLLYGIDWASTLILYPCFAVGFFSLVRRIKAGSLWSNSFLHHASVKMVHWVKRFFQNRRATFRMTFALIMALLLALILGILVKQGLYLPAILLFVGGAFVYCLIFLRLAADMNQVLEETEFIADGDLNHKIPDTLKSTSMKELGHYINHISDSFSLAVEEQVKSERFRVELITNVSHDIKTPLTSIINYVDLLKKEGSESPVAQGYLDVLENKSWRLKTLIEDLVEASKASSGAITLHMEKLNLPELVRQSCGEFEERLLANDLSLVMNISPDPIYIYGDGRSTFRIMENLLSNAGKYALKGTRIYVDLTLLPEGKALFSIKNISAEPLNMTEEELLSRFSRGDQSRNTEGNGLGLSIASSLAALEHAEFHIIMDGDLFKATLTFDVLKEDPKEEEPPEEPATPL